MPRINYKRALMMFNNRVLEQGSMDDVTNLTIEGLRKKLFFNQVVQSNLDELYQKYRMGSYSEFYVEMMRSRNGSIGRIVETIDAMKQCEIVWDTVHGFGREIYESVSSKLASDDALHTDVIRHADGHPDYIRRREIFQDGGIYFVRYKQETDEIVIYSVNEDSEYWTTIYVQETSGDNPLYIKNDTVISRALGPNEDVAVVRVTMDSNDDVTKVEYHGSINTMNMVDEIFPYNAIILHNPFLYTDDLMRIIDSMIKIPKKEFGESTELNFMDIIHDDVLIEYPYDSFDYYLKFLEMAANSKLVESIDITLYRIGSDPAIFNILQQAVKNGIQVNGNLELTARGEGINFQWLQTFHEAGIKLHTYQFGECKVHCKLTLVKFKNGSSICQIGTGNYHTKTTAQYTDISLFTADTSICTQARTLFDILYEKKDSAEFNEDFLVSRFNCREQLIQHINAEGDKGDQGFICFKCNALEDPDIIDALEIASINGCHVILIIRGACTLVPSRPTMVIKSIVWDKLEHSRVYCFGKENPTIFIGSLDPVTNKLDHRIETLVQIKDSDTEIKVAKYLNRYITHRENSWLMTPFGGYVKELTQCTTPPNPHG